MYFIKYICLFKNTLVLFRGKKDMGRGGWSNSLSYSIKQSKSEETLGKETAKK